MTTKFKRAFAVIAVPIVVLSLVSIGGAASEGFYWLWYLAAVIWVVVVILAVILALVYTFTTASDRRLSASGIWAGIAVGAVALGSTCFANLSTWSGELY